jgi:hypothetical protein
VTVFARLVLRDVTATVAFLHALVLGERTALDIVLTTWAEHSAYFHGRHATKLW